MALDMDGDEVVQQCEHLSAVNWTLKMAKMSNFIMLFYNRKKNMKRYLFLEGKARYQLK